VGFTPAERAALREDWIYALEFRGRTTLGKLVGGRRNVRTFRSAESATRRMARGFAG
jgi:hypothetical protein